MFHISKWYCAIIHVRSEHMWKQASVYKENNDSGCFVSLFHNDGSQTALCTCGELSALCPRAVRLEQRTKAPWLIPWLTMCSCVLKNGTGDRCFLSVHIQGIPPNSTNAPPPSPSHDSTLHTCGYSLPRHANWSQLCGCGWGVHGWLKGCWSLRACVQVWEGAGWGCHVCILRVATPVTWPWKVGPDLALTLAIREGSHSRRSQGWGPHVICWSGGHAYCVETGPMAERPAPSLELIIVY